MAVLATQLVGRAAELDAVEEAFAEVDGGRPVAVELVGEPGIGKTRLLAELARRADERGQLVLSGRASELERDLPFWLFVDALDEYVQGLDPRRLANLDEDVLVELSHVFPSLPAPPGDRAPSPQDERYRTHRAVCDLLERLAATRPLALVLDDLHWADAASVELIGALLRRPPAAGVLLALAVRPRQVPERLSAALERARRDGMLTRLELGELSLGEAGELLGDAVDGGAAAALYEESGGNPFYLEQLARSVKPGARPSAVVPGMSLGDVEVPPAVAGALVEELSLLSAPSRRVLEGAAVAGDPFEPELAAAGAAVPEASAVEALDELLRLDLVRHTDVPRRFRFRHPLVRRAVYEATPGGWRLGAHERSAGALAERGASAAARAHHVEASARHGDAAAVAILREAGEAAARLAPASAARWFAGALRLLPATAPPEERVELLLARAGALAATGHFADGHAALLESIALVPPESSALRVRLIGACAGIEHLLGRHDDAHARLVRGLEDVADERSPDAVALMIELTLDGFYRAAYDAMIDWSIRAVDAARAVDDPPLLAAAVGVRTLACAFTGSVAEGLEHGDEAASLVAALSDEELALRLDAVANLAGAELYLDRFDEAGAHATRAIAVARATGQGNLFPVTVVTLATVMTGQGRLPEAAALLDGAIEAARLSGNAQVLAWQLLNRAFVALAAGDLETAEAAGQESVDLTRDLEQSLVSAWAGASLAAPLLQGGDPDGAAEALIGSAGGEELPLIPGGWRVQCLELLTRCQLARDRRDDAERAVACAEARAQAVGLGMARAMAHRAAAALALHDGAGADAADRALAATAGFEEVGQPIEAALSRTLAGRGLAQAGERERAVEELQRAAVELDRLGAARYRDAAERELGKLGHRIPRRTRAGTADGDGIGSLTERERQVAQLVVDRRTNAEIAAELFLSTKTIESHMRNIFVKLGVSSRVELARTVERSDRAR